MISVDHEQLELFARQLAESFGAPQSVATIVADSLVMADLRGHTSHGTRRLAGKYHREVEEGLIKPDSEPEVRSEGDSWAQIDGNWAFGQVVGRLATSEAVEKAREHGVGISTLNQTTHIGRVGEFAELAAREGMIFTAFVSNPGNSWVAPAGSSHRRLSTNPIALGVPTFDALDFPYTIDFATSQVAHGKITAAAVRGDDVPEGWLIDDDGQSLEDPTVFEEEEVGALLPLGGKSAGYKGYSLSVMSELMSGNLSDGSVSGDDNITFGNHAVFTAIDAETFTTRERAAERAAVMADYIRSSDFSADYGPGMAAKGDELLLPGEYEHRSEVENRRHGVELSDKDVEQLVAVATEMGVPENSIPDSF